MQSRSFSCGVRNPEPRKNLSCWAAHYSVAIIPLLASQVPDIQGYLHSIRLQEQVHPSADPADREHLVQLLHQEQYSPLRVSFDEDVGYLQTLQEQIGDRVVHFHKDTQQLCLGLLFEVLMRTVGKDYDKIITTTPASEHEQKKTQNSEVKEAERVLLQVLQTCVDLNPFLKLYGEQSVAKMLRFFVNMKTRKCGREDDNLREGPRADHHVQELRAVGTSHAASSFSHTTILPASSSGAPATTSSTTSTGAGASTTRNNYRRTWASLFDTVRFDRI